jgi:hypothetical protein
LNFSKIAKPITELLKKDNKYVWSADCDEAFLTLKKSSPVLVQFDIACLSTFIVMLLALGWNVSLCKKGE